MPTNVIGSSARSGFALGLTSGIVLASAFFLLRGESAAPRQAAVDSPAPSAAAVSTRSPQKMVGSGSAGSMEAATLALRTRLAAGGGPGEQWELLAQSYEFLGRSEDARLARQRRVSSGNDLRDTIALSAPGLAPARPAAAPGGDAAARIASAEQHRRKREFKEACADYAVVVRLGAMNADTWADYADAQASLAGRLSGAPEQAIDRALSLDPKHTKALWLKASLAHEQHRYDDAVAAWQQLSALVPAGSSDARIVEANIAEAKQLASG
jgi:cytochrome c-type biogenesis protein CcmH/NrfG